MEKNKIHSRMAVVRLLSGTILGLVALAFLGSLFAWLQGPDCGACGGARDLLGGRSLALLGTFFYGGLLAWGILIGSSPLYGSRLFCSGLLLAASVHLVLLLALWQGGIYCGPCILVGLAVILAGGLSLWTEPDNLARASLLLPLGALLAQVGLFTAARGPDVPSEAALHRLLSRPSLEAPTPAGKAELLIYTRSGCRYCEELEEDVLPELLREFGSRLAVSRETAPPSLPTPTLVVTGAERSVFPGLPQISVLRTAILRALGKVNDESSMLPEPR